MLLASCVNTPIDHKVSHNLLASVARCSVSCVNWALERQRMKLVFSFTGSTWLTPGAGPQGAWRRTWAWRSTTTTTNTTRRRRRHWSATAGRDRTTPSRTRTVKRYARKLSDFKPTRRPAKRLIWVTIGHCCCYHCPPSPFTRVQFSMNAITNPKFWFWGFHANKRPGLARCKKWNTLTNLHCFCTHALQWLVEGERGKDTKEKELRMIFHCTRFSAARGVGKKTSDIYNVHVTPAWNSLIFAQFHVLRKISRSRQEPNPCCEYHLFSPNCTCVCFTLAATGWGRQTQEEEEAESEEQGKDGREVTKSGAHRSGWTDLLSLWPGQ